MNIFKELNEYKIDNIFFKFKIKVNYLYFKSDEEIKQNTFDDNFSILQRFYQIIY